MNTLAPLLRLLHNGEFLPHSNSPTIGAPLTLRSIHPELSLWPMNEPVTRKTIYHLKALVKGDFGALNHKIKIWLHFLVTYKNLTFTEIILINILLHETVCSKRPYIIPLNINNCLCSPHYLISYTYWRVNDKKIVFRCSQLFLIFQSRKFKMDDLDVCC